MGDTSAAEDKDEDRGTPMDDPAAIWLSTSALVKQTTLRVRETGKDILKPLAPWPALVASCFTAEGNVRRDEEVRR